MHEGFERRSVTHHAAQYSCSVSLVVFVFRPPMNTLPCGLAVCSVRCYPTRRLSGGALPNRGSRLGMESHRRHCRVMSPSCWGLSCRGSAWLLVLLLLVLGL